MNGPDFRKAELMPCIAQDAESGLVLMLAYMNEEAYNETLKTGRVCYYSRSRKKLWRKGEESGNVQHLKAIYFDCDADAILVKVQQVGGAACHEGFPAASFAKSIARLVTSLSWVRGCSIRRRCTTSRPIPIR